VDAALGWYLDMCLAHRVRSRIARGVWRALDPMPALHSAALVVEPTATVADVEAALAEAPHGGVADCFASLDLAPLGLSPLFDATWIWRAAPAPAPAPPGWSRVDSAERLAAWNAGWDTAGVLLPEHLHRPTFAVLEATAAGRVRAGCVATLGTGLVYVSNVHAVGAGDPAVDWDDVVAAVAALFPGRPLAGYERDADLTGALRAGFAAVGTTRIWVGGTRGDCTN
jgi:hypothetical protein